MLSPAAWGDAEPGAVSQQQSETGVWLRRLLVTQFRCYEETELRLGAGPVVLTGPNGAGKTNLLEAISFLSPGRGLRRARLSEIDRRTAGAQSGTRPWTVAATVETPEGPRDLGSGRDPAQADGAAQGNGGRERRLVRVDGAAARGQQALAEILSVVWLTPQMDGLFREGAGGRRRFLDRLDMVARLQSACDGAEGPFPKVDLGLEGAVEDWLRGGPALAAEDRLRDGLAARRRQDAESGGAGLGPHRSDLLAHHRAKGVAAELCSTGEQKALLIAILLAHARLLTLERGAAPLLLLDEVAAHLDAARRAALYEEILDLGAQAWLTGTDVADFDGLAGRAQFFSVHDGTVQEGAAAP